MLDQVVDLGVNSMYASNTEDFYNTDTIEFDSFDSDFEDFFEKTKTLALNSELDEAFEYFGMNYETDSNEFKKMYRVLAKQYHPDVNKDPSAAVEMKRINMYKSIVEEYFERNGE
ncbi:hypothetical protein Zmor_011795 [Zophobas morio]|uniref:J domain-containing protein n=1 Tax=Zophobas morio TaxID=2755281 RepID=A0AA38LZB7_9CUCU|nr:hypothetical protein Zmor_011795 [Zophobas morio]